MENTNKYADKIAALLAKAESTTPEEAQILTDKAAELMVKYGIEQAMIDAKRVGSVKKEEIITGKIEFTGIYSAGMVMMAHNVVMAFDTMRTYQSKWARRDDKGKKVAGSTLYIVGFESDVRQAEVLLSSLQLQCVVALRSWWDLHEYKSIMTAMESFKERRQFVVSFGSGAASRIREVYTRVVKEETAKTAGTDLVLVDRKALVNAEVDKMNLRKSRGFSSGGAGAAGAGRAAGRSANVGTRGGSVGGSGARGIGR